DQQPPAEASVPHRVLDLLDETALRAALADAGAEAVCHLGEIPNVNRAPTPRAAYVINTQIGSLVMEAAIDAGAKHVIYTSSCQVYGFWGGEQWPITPAKLPLTEDEPLQPQNAYGLSKVANEMYGQQLAARRQVSVTAFRFPAVLSEKQFGHWLDHRLAHGLKPIERSDMGTLVHVDDAAEAYRLALEARPPGFEAFHFVDAEILCSRPAREMFLELYPAAPLPQDWPPAAAPVSLEKAHRLLGWRPKHSMRQRYLAATQDRVAAAG
ncbi:MAG TPA: NAD(P)-dependent oxidoreductase, partial [Tepidisphaeraceae bacterium]